MIVFHTFKTLMTTSEIIQPEPSLLTYSSLWGKQIHNSGLYMSNQQFSIIPEFKYQYN